MYKPPGLRSGTFTFFEDWVLDEDWWEFEDVEGSELDGDEGADGGGVG